MKFKEILDEYGIACRTEGRDCRAGWLQIKCPYCSRPEYMGYNIAGAYTNCWKCGWMPLVDTLALLINQPRGFCRSLLGLLEKEKNVERKRPGKLILPPGRMPMEDSPAHCNYLARRGYSWPDMERLWDIEAIRMCNGLNWRIFIPIYHQGEIVSWTSRSIGTPRARYISANVGQEAVPHKSILYGADYCRHAIIVCEGPLDVWCIGPGAVATCGTGYSQAQIRAMSRYSVRAICFDNEREAQQRARNLLADLSVFPGETMNIRLDAKDPGEASAEEIDEVRKILAA